MALTAQARAEQYATNPLILQIVGYTQVEPMELAELTNGFHNDPHVWCIAIAQNFFGQYQPYIVIRNGDEKGTRTGAVLREFAEGVLRRMRIPYVVNCGDIYIAERTFPIGYRIPEEA
jgi:hypothetical protein